ncbi:hypothetical protein [Membranihabitans maritimus]|uniref:hypothetical protein n=1 Tax=Membranihabitans maritimus TaxID=2904244 RepID=UPI001F3E13AB|nr:hypothetical protein [Membranihabitans maritimus]
MIFVFQWIRFTLLIILIPIISQGKIVVVNGLTHTFNLAGEDQSKGVIQLKNIGNESKSVLIYQTDYSFNYKGETRYGEPGSLDRSNAGWLNITPVSVTLEPKEEKQVNFSIEVPGDVELIGTYWSAIMVEPSDLLDEGQNRNGVRIRTVFRYAIQVITNINGTGKPDLDFIDVNLRNSGEESHLDIDVINKGNGFINAIMNVEIFDQQGSSIGVFSSKRLRTLPSTSKRYRVDIPKLERGT